MAAGFEAALPQIQEMGGSIVGVSSETPPKIAEAWAVEDPLYKAAEVGLVSYTQLLDETNEAAKALDVVVSEPSASRTQSYPNGMAQPACFVFGKDGNLVYAWRHAPAGDNLRGAIQRPVPADVIKVIKGEKASDEVQIDPQLALVRIMSEDPNKPERARKGAKMILAKHTTKAAGAGGSKTPKEDALTRRGYQLVSRTVER